MLFYVMENIIETREETVSDVQGRFECAEKNYETVLKRLSDAQQELEAALGVMWKIRDEARQKQVPLW
jgi:hypothetical protein